MRHFSLQWVFNNNNIFMNFAAKNISTQVYTGYLVQTPNLYLIFRFLKKKELLFFFYTFSFSNIYVLPSQLLRICLNHVIIAFKINKERYIFLLIDFKVMIVLSSERRHLTQKCCKILIKTTNPFLQNYRRIDKSSIVFRF